MQLIDEIEISYFRSFYKFKLSKTSDINIIFGKNDSGKSNLVRALNLFFSGSPDHAQDFDFPIDFCEQRNAESDTSEDIRKFLYVKITFNTPTSYQPSLGKSFYVKRQWTVSRGQAYNEEFSSSIPSQRRHIAARLLNKIRFIYIPAIKDIRIFEFLLALIHESIAESPLFSSAVDDFSQRIQNQTKEMFKTLPKEVSNSTKIGAPTQLSQLFQTLDFETVADGELSPKSLTRQRGDGIKVRHIPELLSFISEHDKYDYHIWGFEEPENSLDFVSVQSEAERFLKLAESNKIQIFITTHSPSFYLLEGGNVSKYYVSKDDDGLSNPIQGKKLLQIDPMEAIHQGFYLPAVAEALKDVATVEQRAAEAEREVETLKAELLNISSPVILTEGRTDAKILLTAWKKRRGGTPPFAVRSCETGGDNAGSGNGGAVRLALRLKGIAADHPHTVIGIFDCDAAGIAAYKLDKNFSEISIGGHRIKKGINGQSFAMLLPAPDFRADCALYENLPIEFLFRDEDINKNIDGVGLRLTRKKASTKLGEKKFEFELEDLTSYKDISGGKVEFCEKIVPSLPSAAFESFDRIFYLLEEIILKSKQPE